MPGTTVEELLARHERERPEHVAFDIDGRRMTWGELARAARDVAAGLQRVLGVTRGDHVAILMPNSIEWVVWALACGLAGATIVPLNTRLQPDEVAYQLAQSDAAAVVTDGRYVELLERVGAHERSGERFPRLRHVVVLGDDAGALQWATPYEPPAVGPAAPAERGTADDVLIMQYTSGTTAFPKGALLTQGQVLLNAAGVAGRMHVSDRDRVCSPSPFFHSGGSTLLLFLGLVTGATVLSFGRFDPADVLATIEREQATIYNGIESFFIGLLKDPSFAPERVRSVRTGWIAASAELVGQVHEEMGMTGIINVYGVSEASPNVTIADADAPPEVRRTCGPPHSGTEVRIVDERTGEPLGANRSGLIEVRGPCVMQGYYAKPDATAEVLGTDGWLKTGDRGRLDDAGNLVYEGRGKEMLRVGGENVAPAEVESALLRHPDIAQAAVIGIPHEELQEVPAAFVAPEPGRSLDPAAVSEYAAERLAKFKVPRTVHVLDELPMTGSGKVQKFRLAELVADPEGGS